MISGSKLSRYLWSEAINTANYIVNRSPTTANKGITPEECYTKKKPDVSNLCIFVCLAYMHIPKQNRNKLESKTLKCLLMGYDSHSKAYRVFEPHSCKIYITRDIIFDETKIGMDHMDTPRLSGSSPLPFPNSFVHKSLDELPLFDTSNESIISETQHMTEAPIEAEDYEPFLSSETAAPLDHTEPIRLQNPRLANINNPPDCNNQLEPSTQPTYHRYRKLTIGWDVDQHSLRTTTP